MEKGPAGSDPLWVGRGKLKRDLSVLLRDPIRKVHVYISIRSSSPLLRVREDRYAFFVVVKSYRSHSFFFVPLDIVGSFSNPL
jgi:hypothetical protein